jgi:hypothetical protein
MADEDARRYQSWLPKRFDLNASLPDLPAAIYSSHISPRISTQRSCFTIHGVRLNGLEEVANEEKSKMVKVIIPGNSVRRIKQELVISGIDEITVYPDLDGLGRFLTNVLKVQSSQMWLAGDDRGKK